jgi:hemoglobin-like flavoprotein
MDDKTKELVTESWAKVLPISEKAADLFYGKLFELDPTLKLLFKAPIPVQGKLLMKALDGAISSLNDLGALVPVLQELGKRHASYGVIEKDYDTVGESLLWTLEQGLGDGFTDEVKAGWTEVYGVVATVMKEAQATVEVRGPVSPRQKRLVQGSWEAVVPISDKAAEIFYAKLFELDATLEPLFKSDMTEQGKTLMQMLTVAVKGLDSLGDTVPAVQALGARHATYGVKDEDYDTVAEALIFTLEQGLGDVLTDEVKDSWVVVYTLLATTMKDAAADASSTQKKTTPSSKSESGASTGILFTALALALMLGSVALGL